MLLFWIRHECAGQEHNDQRWYGGSAVQPGWAWRLVMVPETRRGE